MIASASGSIIPSVLAHFTLNGFQALSAYALKDTPTNDMAATFSWAQFRSMTFTALFFTAVSAIIIYQILKRCDNLHLLKKEPEESLHKSFPPLQQLWPFLALAIIFLILSILTELIPS